MHAEPEGVTYGAWTDTLSRSSSVELCKWLAQQSAMVMAHDPAVNQLPPKYTQYFQKCATALGTLDYADVLVIATECAEYRDFSTDDVVSAMRTPIVVDSNRFLARAMEGDPRELYVVGTPQRMENGSQVART